MSTTVIVTVCEEYSEKVHHHQSMVLIIDDQEVSSLEGDEIFAQFPGLREKSAQLVEKGLREVRMTDYDY